MRISALINTLNSASTSAHRAAFGGLMLVALIIRIAAFQGYLDSDPRDYTVLADDLAHGTLRIPAYDGAPVFPLRLGVYAPVTALFKVFGLSEVTTVAYPFLISILGCLLTYALARYLVTPFVGLIALALLSIVPIDIGMASLLFPDAIAAFWANLAVAAALIALRRAGIRQVSVLGLLSGLLFGVSWLCKESVVYLVPFVFILVWFCGSKTTKAGRAACFAAIGVGAAAVLIAEMIFYRKLTGDFLFRLHGTERNYLKSPQFYFDSSSPLYGWKAGGYTKALLLRLFVSGPRDLIFDRQMICLPAAAIISAIWALKTRQQKLYLPILWLGSLLLMFNFMSSSFSAYKPLILFARYTYPVLVPSLILVGGLLAGLLAGGAGSKIQNGPRIALIMGICFLGMSAFVGRKIYTSRPEQIERRVAARLTKDDVIYTDFRSATSLVFFRTGSLEPADSKTIPWEGTKLDQIPNGAYVLVEKAKITSLAVIYKYESPSYVLQPPLNWKIVQDYTGGELYQVNAH